MKIVIIARHYPPEVSGGARRPSLYAAALRGRGHHVRVVSPFAPQHPDDLQVVGPPLPQGDAPARARPLRTALARGLRYPDAENGWANRVAARLSREDAPDWLITTSPPESVHMCGTALKTIWADTLWLAEFRDTWTVRPHRKEAGRFPRRHIERWMARRILARADAIAAVSPFVMDEVAAYAHPDTPRHIEGHFSDLPPEPHDFGEGFHLLHSGGFRLSDPKRSLRALLTELDPLARSRPDLRLHITGRLASDEKGFAAARPWVTAHGPVSLDASRAMQAGADALLLATPPDSHALPGKFAEYALAGRPMVATGGGSWRKLLPDGITLLDIDTLETLEAGTTIPPLTALSATEAAQRLETFLLAVASRNKTADSSLIG